MEFSITIPELVATIVKKINTCRDASAYFFISYAGFMTGLELLDQLFALFYHSEDDPTRSRILSCLNRLIDSYWCMFSKEVGVLIEKLASETTKIMNAPDGTAKYHKFFESVLAKILKKRASTPSFQELVFPNFTEEIDSSLNWSAIHPIHFAHQLTLYQQMIYQKITTADLLFYKVTSPVDQLAHESPLHYFINHFNSLAKFVKVELLMESDTKTRCKAVKKFIALADVHHHCSEPTQL